MLRCKIVSSTGIVRFLTVLNDVERRVAIIRVSKAVRYADSTCRPGFREMIDNLRWVDIR